MWKLTRALLDVPTNNLDVLWPTAPCTKKSLSKFFSPHIALSHSLHRFLYSCLNQPLFQYATKVSRSLRWNRLLQITIILEESLPNKPRKLLLLSTHLYLYSESLLLEQAVTTAATQRKEFYTPVTRSPFLSSMHRKKIGLWVPEAWHNVLGETHLKHTYCVVQHNLPYCRRKANREVF